MRVEPAPVELPQRLARTGAATVTPSSRARTSASVSGLPSTAVELCVLRARVSFWSAGIQATCTVALWIRSRSAAMLSTRFNKTGVMLKNGL